MDPIRRDALLTPDPGTIRIVQRTKVKNGRNPFLSNDQFIFAGLQIILRNTFSIANVSEPDRLSDRIAYRVRQACVRFRR